MARISEMHYSNAYAKKSGVDEFLELALSEGEDPADFTAAFYDRDGSLILEVPLTDPRVSVTQDSDSGETVYVIQNGAFNIQLTDPDGSGATNSEAFALVNTDTGEVADFYDIGGGTQEITATEGVAAGATSVNVPAPTVPNLATYSIQFNHPDPSEVSYETLSLGDTGVICFTPGTFIDTPGGSTCVEVLRPGDLVDTLDHGPQALRWVGQRTVPAQGALAPVVISAGVLGNPRPLVVSPQHRVLLSDWRAELLFDAAEVLVPARFLIDGDRVYARTGGEVTYVHLLFDRHEIVFSEGVPSESFHPGVYGLATLPWAQRAEVEALFPQLRDAAPAGFGPGARKTLKPHEARLMPV